MGKLCKRNYAGNGMLSVKMVDGVGMCPSCGQPAICHNLTVEARALFWALALNTGTSSKALAKHMTGFGSKQYMSPPSDRDDRSRCIQLLGLIPEWIDRLNEMVQYDEPKADAGITISSNFNRSYENSWAKQIPLIMQEAKF